MTLSKGLKEVTEGSAGGVSQAVVQQEGGLDVGGASLGCGRGGCGVERLGSEVEGGRLGQEPGSEGGSPEGWGRPHYRSFGGLFNFYFKFSLTNNI